jgi:hypothetical protein
MQYDFTKLHYWLKEKISHVRYGEIVIKVTLHDGQIREVSRAVEEKERG